jgi:hypothetical protein
MNGKIKMIRESVEEIARMYFGIPTLYKEHQGGSISLTHKQIERALRESYKMGERSGYRCGYDDAKEACDCVLDEKPVEVPLSTIDLSKQLV